MSSLINCLIIKGRFSILDVFVVVLEVIAPIVNDFITSIGWKIKRTKEMIKIQNRMNTPMRLNKLNLVIFSKFASN